MLSAMLLGLHWGLNCNSATSFFQFDEPDLGYEYRFVVQRSRKEGFGNQSLYAVWGHSSSSMILQTSLLKNECCVSVESVHKGVGLCAGYWQEGLK